MDEPIIKYYRKLMRSDFEYVGSLENPSIFLDSVGEKVRVCGHNAQNYLHIFIRVADRRVAEVKYLCTCDPVANVVVEVFCKLVDGKTLKEAGRMTTEMFSRETGSVEKEFLKKSGGIIELLQRGLARYRRDGSEY